MIIYAKIASVEDLINKNHLISVIDMNDTKEVLNTFEYYIKQLKKSYIPLIGLKHCYKPYIYFNDWKYYDNIEKLFEFISIIKEFKTDKEEIISRGKILEILSTNKYNITLKEYYINSPDIEEQKYGRINNYFQMDDINGQKIDYDILPFRFTNNIEKFI